MSFLILFMSLKWYFSRQILQNVMREMTADWLLLTTTNATAASWKIATQYSIQQIFSFHMPCQDTNECISKLDQAKSSVVFFTIKLGVGGIGFEKLILLVYRESRDRMHEKLRSPILRELSSLGTQTFMETCDIIAHRNWVSSERSKILQCWNWYGSDLQTLEDKAHRVLKKFHQRVPRLGP